MVKMGIRILNVYSLQWYHLSHFNGSIRYPTCDHCNYKRAHVCHFKDCKRAVLENHSVQIGTW